MKLFIDEETTKEINQAMWSVPLHKKWNYKKNNEEAFKQIKAQKLTENFIHVEPLLLE